MLLQSAIWFHFFNFLISWMGYLPINSLRTTHTPDDQRSFILLKKSVGEIYEDLKKIAETQVYNTIKTLTKCLNLTNPELQTKLHLG